MTDKQLLTDCLKLAEATRGADAYNIFDDVLFAERLASRLKSALAEQGTAAAPVAWGVFDSDYKLLEATRTREAAESWLQYDGARIVVPLYTHPPQQQARVTRIFGER